MGMVISNGTDVVDFLRSQHEQVKGLLTDVLASRGADRSQAFYALRRMLAVHETAEEEVIHPAARRHLANGSEIVRSRLEEENKAKKALTELESLDVDSAEFESKFQTLQGEIIVHADSEEELEFATLANKLDPKQLKSMRRAVEFAEAIAPSRPHAGVESAMANILSGPFMAMVDRTRDAISGKAKR
jgi:hemerythrin superfamily protein